MQHCDNSVHTWKSLSLHTSSPRTNHSCNPRHKSQQASRCAIQRQAEALTTTANPWRAHRACGEVHQVARPLPCSTPAMQTLVRTVIQHRQCKWLCSTRMTWLHGVAHKVRGGRHVANSDACRQPFGAISTRPRQVLAAAASQWCAPARRISDRFGCEPADVLMLSQRLKRP